MKKTSPLRRFEKGRAEEVDQRVHEERKEHHIDEVQIPHAPDANGQPVPDVASSSREPRPPTLPPGRLKKPGLQRRAPAKGTHRRDELQASDADDEHHQRNGEQGAERYLRRPAVGALSRMLEFAEK